METIQSLFDFHRLLSLSPPLHPLVSVVQISELHVVKSDVWRKYTTNFYSIALKNNIQSRIRYGQNYYDFQSGTMVFTAPKQVQSVEVENSKNLSDPLGTGYVLMFHPDFLGKHPLSNNIKTYGFFGYALNEALHLSQKEESNIISIFKKIEEEYQYIDNHTQSVIISQIDLLLTYSNRFYERQFITRKVVNNDLLNRTQLIIGNYFDNDNGLENGRLTVKYLAKKLSISPNYLSDALRSISGQSAQQTIHDSLIEKAKEYLTTSNLTVSEIAYRLGFERPQSFNKLFKNKTEMSPLEFKTFFN